MNSIEIGYIPEMDRTVIFKEELFANKGTTEIVGWLYGKYDLSNPNEKETIKEFIENLKAKFER